MPRTSFLLLLALACGPALASSFAGTTAGSASDSSSDGTSSTSGDDKVVQAAREEAASFVATAGGVRGARLEAALLYLREQGAAATASDLELARAILAR